jgi:hypothetical protein
MYEINITENVFHPKYETIFKVYIGAHNFVKLNNNIAPAQVLDVSSSIVVGV